MNADLEQLPFDLKEELKKLRVKTLVIQGRQDPIGEKTAEQIHKHCKKSNLVFIDKAGHFPWIENADDFFTQLFKFLK